LNADHEYRLYVFGRIVNEEDGISAGGGQAIIQAPADPWTWISGREVEDTDGYFVHTVTLNFENVSDIVAPQFANAFRIQHDQMPARMYIYEIALYRVPR